MNIVIFGLSISSSWGNGHATIWRGLIRELIAKKHTVTFFEKNVPYYAQNRDFYGMAGLNLILYDCWSEIELNAATLLNFADIGIVTSYCPDALVASDLILAREVPLHIFYDLDAAVTVKNFETGKQPFYIGKRLFKDYDFVLSYTGGEVLNKIKSQLGAAEVFPLYGCVDPIIHKPVQMSEDYSGVLSYLGTYAVDRQNALMTLFIETAKRNPQNRFVLGGAQYPGDIKWPHNVHFVTHVPPGEHSEFYCSSQFTLNITRKDMAEMGFSPSGRIFEAAACGVPVLSDLWPGVEEFFTPGEEIIIVKDTDEVINALRMPERERIRIAQNAYQKVLKQHTALQRVEQLECIIKEF